MIRRTEHGGDIRLGKRKLARPIDPKRPMHLVMRSHRAQGQRNLLHPRNVRRVQALVYRWGHAFDVEIQRYANVGNHLHLLVKARTRKGFQQFLKAATGTVAMHATGARKGQKSGRFWELLAYSCVVNTKVQLRRVQKYIVQNVLEGHGLNDRRAHPPPWRIA